MRTLVESYKRLYKQGKLTPRELRIRVERGLIDGAEFKFITGEDYE